MEVQDSEALAAALELLIQHPDQARAMGAAARPMVKAGHDELSRLARQCLSLGGLLND